METHVRENQLFALTKEALVASPALAKEFEDSLQHQHTDAQVVDFWDSKLYQLEEASGNNHQLHHRIYLQEASTDNDFWIKYLTSQVLPIFA